MHELDLKYICDEKNLKEIEENIKRRKLSADVQLIRKLYSQVRSAEPGEEKNSLIVQLTEEALKVPNRLKSGLGDDPELIRLVGEKSNFNFRPKLFEDLAK